jgi:nucleoside-diphosphate-sugar epimerase
MVSAFERARSIRRIVGMARRPFDPADQGWKKTEYRQGDVQDRKSVREAVKGVDVVVHLAFAILDAGERTRGINVDGSRTVFEEAVRAGAERICYASSVAAYGFHDDNPDWLDEDIPARGTPAHFYSQQKSEVEQVLSQVLMKTESMAAYVFRPCIVAGPRAQTMLEEIPYYRLSERLPKAVVNLLASMPALKPVIPDPGIHFQLVHEDDVASAFVAGVRGRGAPGPYNLAGKGTLTMSDVADALGWYSIPVPGIAVDATAEVVARMPGMPEIASWIQSARKPVLMKTDRARKELGWRPEHTARGTLRELVEAYRTNERVH